MIYTIRCRRGHCGARFEYDGSNSDPVHNEQILGQRAISQGWFIDMQAGGWLCPFDAPKEAAKPEANEPAPHTVCARDVCLNCTYAIMESQHIENGWHRMPNGTPSTTGLWLCPYHAPKEAPKTAYTTCSYPGCHNANTNDVPGSSSGLIKDGWRRVKVDLGPAQWFCPTCWKTTQPEPAQHCALPGCISFFTGPKPADWEECKYTNAHVYICPACYKRGVIATPLGLDYEPAPEPSIADWNIRPYVSIDEVKEIAAEVFYHSMSRLLRSAKTHSDARRSVLDLLEIGLTYLKLEEDNAQPNRGTGSPDTQGTQDEQHEIPEGGNGSSPTGSNASTSGNKAKPNSEDYPF